MSARSASPPWWKAYVAPTVIVAVVLGAAARSEYRLEGLDTRLRTVETGLASLDSRLRTVEIGLASLDSRLRTVEIGLGSLDARLHIVETGHAEMRGRLTRYRADALGFDSPQIERVSLRSGAGFRATLTDGVGRTRYDLTYTIIEIGPERITFRIDGRVDNAVMQDIVVSTSLRPGSLTPIHALVVRGLPTLAIAILDRSPGDAVVAVGPLKTEKAA